MLEVTPDACPAFPSALQNETHDAVCCLNASFTRDLGGRGAADSFFAGLRRVLCDGGVFVAVVVDTSVVHRRTVLESTRGEASSEAYSAKVRQSDANAPVFSLSLAADASSACEDVGLYNMAQVLRSAESHGFEVLECTNLVEIIYTHHSHDPWKQLLIDYGVLTKTRTKVDPAEKAAIELFTTLALRKKTYTPSDLWAKEGQAFAAHVPDISAGGGAAKEYGAGPKQPVDVLNSILSDDESDIAYG